MLKDSVAMHLAVHGREHPDTLKALNALGTLYLNHGEILAARETFGEVLELRRKLLGPRHISVGRVLGNLGTVNYHMGNYRAAMAQYTESLDIFREALGDAHPRIAFLKENIANVYLATGEQDLAYSMYLESIARMREIFGDTHIETGMTTSNMGGALIDMERFAQARPYLIEADRIFRETLGEDHAFVANNMLKLGQSEQGMGQYDTAEVTYRAALALAGKSLAAEHPDMLKIQYALADTLMLQGRLAESERLIQSTLTTWREIEPGGGSFTARTAGLLGDCLTRMQRFDEAEMYLLESHEALATIQTADHKHLIEARQRLADLYLAWDRPENAKTYQRVDAGR